MRQQAFRCSIIVLLFIQLTNCKEACEADFFDKQIKDTAQLSLIFRLSKGTKEGALCGYNHRFKYWLGDVVDGKAISYLEWDGDLFNKDEVIYLRLKNGNTVKYFDFGLPIDQPERVEIVQNRNGFSIKRSYSLIHEEKFYDDQVQDTIHKFRFKNINANTVRDLVFYVGYRAGLTGVYNGGIIDGTREEVISSKGNLYPDKSKRHTKQLSKGHLL